LQKQPAYQPTIGFTGPVKERGLKVVAEYGSNPLRRQKDLEIRRIRQASRLTTGGQHIKLRGGGGCGKKNGVHVRGERLISNWVLRPPNKNF